jgi:hypothetical protein
MLLPCFIVVISGDTLYHGVKVTSVRIMCIFLVNVSINCWCLLEPSSAFTVIVWVTRVDSTNVLNEGLRTGEVGHRMNLKVKLVETGVYRK